MWGRHFLRILLTLAPAFFIIAILVGVPDVYPIVLLITDRGKEQIDYSDSDSVTDPSSVGCLAEFKGHRLALLFTSSLPLRQIPFWLHFLICKVGNNHFIASPCLLCGACESKQALLARAPGPKEEELGVRWLHHLRVLGLRDGGSRVCPRTEICWSWWGLKATLSPTSCLAWVPEPSVLWPCSRHSTLILY